MRLPGWLKDKMLAQYPKAKEPEIAIAEFIIQERSNLDLLEPGGLPATTSLSSYKESERKYFCELLLTCKGNLIEGAFISGLARATLYRKVKEFDLEFERQASRVKKEYKV